MGGKGTKSFEEDDELRGGVADLLVDRVVLEKKVVRMEERFSAIDGVTIERLEKDIAFLKSKIDDLTVAHGKDERAKARLEAEMSILREKVPKRGSDAVSQELNRLDKERKALLVENRELRDKIAEMNDG